MREKRCRCCQHLAAAAAAAAAGKYLFEDLAAGDYTLSFPATTPSPGRVLTRANAAPVSCGMSCDDKDSDVPSFADKAANDTLVIGQVLVSIADGKNDLTWDAGYYAGASARCCIIAGCGCSCGLPWHVLAVCQLPS